MTNPATAAVAPPINITQSQTTGNWYGGDLSLPPDVNVVTFNNCSKNPCEIIFVEKGRFEFDQVTVTPGGSSSARVITRKPTHYTISSPKAQGQHRRDVEIDIDISIDITRKPSTAQQYTIDMN